MVKECNDVSLRFFSVLFLYLAIYDAYRADDSVTSLCLEFTLPNLSHEDVVCYSLRIPGLDYSL